MPVLSHHRPGQLLQFTIGEGGLQLDCGRLISADLTFVGMANQRRGHADTCSKVACCLSLYSLPVSANCPQSRAGRFINACFCC